MIDGSLLKGAVGAFVLSFCSAHAPAQASTMSSASAEQGRAVIAAMQRISDPQGVQALEAIDIGGIRQWISVRGKDRRNPVLLFIHGGPGSPMMPLSWTYQQPWEDYFTVVQWDQRGAGKTYAANDPARVAPTMSIDRMVADTEEVVDYLRNKYHQEKIFVVGHSWGTVLGVKLAQAHPEWLHAYVGIGQVVNLRKGEGLSYRKLLQRAEKAGNDTAIKELRGIAPYPDADGSLTMEKVFMDRKWVVQLQGMTYENTDYLDNEIMKLSPDYQPSDLEAGERGTDFTLRALWQEASSLNFESIKRFECPIVFFVGRHDLAVDPELVAEWYRTLQAPAKSIHWFEKSAHYVVFEEPGVTLRRLVEDVLPLARK